MKIKQVDRCIENGVIPIVEEINKDKLDMVSYAISKLFMMDLKKIHFLISSSGGNGRIAIEMFDTIRLWPGEKIGIICGRAHSAAAVITQAFDKRYATVNSTFVIHHGSMTVKVLDLLNPERTAELCKEVKLDEIRYIKLFSQRTGMSEDAVWKLSREDRIVFVEEAIKLGLIDAVWDKPLPWSSYNKEIK